MKTIRNISRVIALLAILILVNIYTANSARAQGKAPNAASPLGINLSSDFSVAQPFLNLVVDAEQWGNPCCASGGLNTHVNDLSLDPQGWAYSSFRGASGTIYADGLGVNLSHQNSFTNYTVFCNGGATITVTNGPSHPSVNCPAGSKVGNAGTLNEAVYFISITKDDQTTNGYHLTFLAIVPTQYASRYQDFLNGTCSSCQFNPVFLQTDAPFRVLRDMDWEQTNSNFQLTDWNTRPTPAQPFYHAAAKAIYAQQRIVPEGVPIEVFTELCNSLQASCWYNIPLNATNNYIEKLAQYVSVTLNQYAYYEYVNEAWNGNALRNALQKLGTTEFGVSSFAGAISYYTMRASQIMDVIKANSSDGRYFRVLGLAPNGNVKGVGCGNCTNYIELGGTDYGNLWKGSGAPQSHFDVAALAPYFGYNLPESWSADSSGLKKAFIEINSGGELPTGADANTTTNKDNNYALRSSTNCGNGSIASTPANMTMTCMKVNATATGNVTLSVDGGPAWPVYKISGETCCIRSYQLSPANPNISARNTYVLSFTSQTGAPAWALSKAYSKGNFVSGSDGNTYVSIDNKNTSNDPVRDRGLHWTAITPAWWIATDKGHDGGMIADAADIASQTLASIKTLGLSLPLVCYESGQSLVNMADPIQMLLYNEINQDARMASTYESYYSRIKATGIKGICNHYDDISVWSIFGAWGFKRNLYDVQSGKQLGLYRWISENPKHSLP